MREKEEGRGVPVVSEVTVALVPPTLAQADYAVSHLCGIVR